MFNLYLATINFQNGTGTLKNFQTLFLKTINNCCNAKKSTHRIPVEKIIMFFVTSIKRKKLSLVYKYFSFDSFSGMKRINILE